MDESKEKLNELARKDKERMMLEKIRNDYESYIYHIKNTLIDKEEEVGAVKNQASEFWADSMVHHPAKYMENTLKPAQNIYLKNFYSNKAKAKL